MMERRRRIWIGILLPLFSGLLAACGGGGGGTGNNSPAGAFTLSNTSFSFSAKHGGATPPTQTVAVHLTSTGAYQIGAGYANGVTPANWLSVTSSGSGSDYTFTLAVNTTAMTSGSYSATLTFGTTDTKNNILNTQTVQVAYTLKDGLDITATSAALSFVSGNSLSSQSVPFTVTGPSGAQWSAASDSPWLAGPAGTQQGPGNFTGSVNVTGLAAGSYTGHLTITNGADHTDTATLAVTVTLNAPTLSLSSQQITLGGVSGLDMSTQPLSFSLNTSQNAFPWTITATTTGGGAWLQASAASGTVSGTSAAVTINAARAGLASGTYKGQIQVQATVNGMPVSAAIPVTLNVDSNRLLVSAAGVAFSSFPSRQVLTRSLNVSNTWGASGVHWQTQADQSWLSVTASGTTGSPLVLTANPAGLGAGQYTAHVTVTSPDSGVSSQEVVRVGLTVASTDPAAVIDLAGVTAKVVVPSPVEPVVFVSSGAAGAPISVYDVNTGALLRTLSGNFTAPMTFAISGNGQTLYVADETATSSSVRVLDATSGALQTSYALPNITWQGGQAQPETLTFARPDAHPVLISSFTGDAFDLSSGAHYSVAINNPGPTILVSPDQSVLYSQDSGFSPASITAYGLVYSTLPSVGLLSTPLKSNNGVADHRSNGEDIALSADGSLLYSAAGAPYELTVLNSTTLAADTPIVTSTSSGFDNVGASWNGLVAFGMGPNSDPAGDIWLLDSNVLKGRLLSGAGTSGSAYAHTLRFSGDGTRLMSATSSGLRIQAAPTP